MSDQSEAATETEAAEATEAEQNAAPQGEAEPADEMSAAWADMVAETTGEPAPPKEDTTTEGEETAPSTDQVEEAEEQAATEDQPRTEEAAEIDWSSAPDELRSAYEAEKARADAAEHGKKSAEGRQAATQRRLDAMIAGAGEKPDKPATRSEETEREETAPAEPSAEWKQVMADYPEIANPLQAELDRISAGYRAEIDELKQSQQQMANALQTVGEDRIEARSAEQEGIVREAHTDYDDIADSDDFVNWANAQPEFIRQGIEANAQIIVDGPAVSKILDMYKADKGIAKVNGNGAAAGEEDPGARKPAADPVREIQRRSSQGLPASSPGAPTREEDPTRTETEADVWAELRRNAQREQAAEARA